VCSSDLTIFPIEDGNLRERITSEILALPLTDNVKARILQPDGSYRHSPARKSSSPRRSQMEFVALALGKKPLQRPAARKKQPYSEMKLRPKPVPA